MRVRLDEDEQYPVLVYRESDQGVEVPDQLISKLEHAKQMVKEAEDEIARWVKFSAPDSDSARDIRWVIDRLPTADERKKARKR